MLIPVKWIFAALKYFKAVESGSIRRKRPGKGRNQVSSSGNNRYHTGVFPWDDMEICRRKHTFGRAKGVICDPI